MRNWRPYIPDVVKQMRADGVEEAAVLCLAPQNSRTSVGLYERAVQAEAGALRIDFTDALGASPAACRCICRTPARRPSQALAETGAPGSRSLHRPQRARPHRRAPAAAELASPASGPPAGPDPYAQDATRTAELVAERVPEIPQWWFAFQSQGASGGPWIGPTVEETLDQIAADGIKTLLLQPIGFLCDHVEILYDVDIAFREYAAKIGIRLERPESLNGSPTLARAVADLALQGLARLQG